MRPFMDKDFLLETETAKHLFHDYYIVCICKSIIIFSFHNITIS